MSDPSSALTFRIDHRPDFSLLTVALAAGQKVYAEPSAMATMAPTIDLKAGFKGGVRKTLGRMLGGESLIVNTYTARQAGEVALAPGVAGDLVHYAMTGNRLYVQRGGYVAHGEGVELTGSWQGARGFFGGHGLILLQASGHGDLFFSSYGAILPIDITDDLVVDTGYVVAFEDTLDYRVTVLPGLGIGSRVKSLFFGGEGLVVHFSGRGRVWVQTRAVPPFLSFIHPFRPVRRRESVGS